jgi:shikimate dehydrogenase
MATVWLKQQRPVVSGIDMLIWQAVAQLRIFVGGNPNEELPNEIAVLEAMRHAV